MSERRTILRTPDSYRDTSVPVHRSVTQIESLLTQFGAEATSVSIARRGEQAVAEIRFAHGQSVYQMHLDLGKDPKDHRQRMRVLCWYTKATLEAVTFGVLTAEEALLPYAEIRDSSGKRTTVARALLGSGGSLPLVGVEEMLEQLQVRALPARAGKARR